MAPVDESYTELRSVGAAVEEVVAAGGGVAAAVDVAVAVGTAAVADVGEQTADHELHGRCFAHVV